MPLSTSSGFVSLFDRVFDAAVFGSGLIGFAAARRLAQEGLEVLLVGATGDLLGEATRALENGVEGPCVAPAWTRWVGELQVAHGADGAYFEPALAEVAAARSLRAAGSTIATLLHAPAVAASSDSGGLREVAVATKSGLRTVRARRWIDATEEGRIARLCARSLVPRSPVALYRSLVMQSPKPEALDQALANDPELACLASVRPGERRLRWRVCGEPPHRRLASMIRGLREIPGLNFVVSHAAWRDFPVYEAGPWRRSSPAVPLPENLRVLSPALGTERMACLAERFEHGWTGVSDIPAGLRERAASFAEPIPEAWPETFDVLVAGAGTAGAVAAIAAARNGAKTAALEAANFPGGIGTGGGINGYFHGAPGGLQSELDRRSQEMTEGFTGSRPGPVRWHHDAKKLALCESLDEAGVRWIGDAVLCGVERDGAGLVKAVLAAVDGGLKRIFAARFIDATGDGDLCALAGAELFWGRPGDRRVLAYSQAAFSLVTAEDGKLSVRSCNYDAGWVDPTDPEDLTRARLEGLSQYWRDDWRRAEPVIAMAPLLGLRQSRQIRTDRVVTLPDMIDHARFEDSIGSVETVADTHSVDFEFESDELAFYYWTCRGFRHRLSCDLPYRMLIPAGLRNVWIACRAAGIDVDASYGLRMQREMQRLGEAAGIAAALACESRNVDQAALRQALEQSGSREADRAYPPVPGTETLLAALDQGKPGIHLWHLYRAWEKMGKAVRERLSSADRAVSFYAAAVCAMGGSPAGEARLLAAIRSRESGVSPEALRVPGAHGECVDLPFWLQAAVLLRRTGGADALEPLRDLAFEPGGPLNVRTIVALTLERLAARLGPHPLVLETLQKLEEETPSDAFLPPSRSLWRTLHGEPQKPLSNDLGAQTSQDHVWQLHLILSRTRRMLDLPPSGRLELYRFDERGFVRSSFATDERFDRRLRQ